MSRKLLLIILIPAALLIGGYLYLRISLEKENKQEQTATGIVEKPDSLGGKKVSAVDLRPVFITRMQQLLKKSSNGLYNLTVGDMELDVLASTVSLHNVIVKADEQSLKALRKTGEVPQNVFDISFKSLVVEGINLDDAITSKTMDYKLVKLVNPVIAVHRQPGKKESKENSEDFSQRFLKEMSRLGIDRLVIEGGSIVTYSNGQKKNQLNEVQVVLSDILLDSATRTDKNRFLFAREARIDFANYTTQTKDGLYRFKIGKGTIRAPQQQISLQGVSFASPLGRQAFMKKQKVAKELFDLSLSAVTMKDVDWWTLFNGEELVAGELTGQSGKLSVYFDRSLPPRSRMGNFPNQLLAKLPLKMNIGKFSIKNLDLSYTEYNPVSRQTGTLYFDNTVLTAADLSTTKTKTLTINGTTMFMHQVPLAASFSFNMSNPKAGGFTADISTNKPFEGSLLNSFSMPLGLMKIDKGTVQQVKATMKGDQLSASGHVLLLYNDLKMELLEKDKGKAALDKKDVTSFLANLFVIKNNNPKKEGDAPRKKAGSFQRDPYGGFFMLVWKTILVGVLKTIGAPEKIATKKANIPKQ